jgi:hypothetical protein
MVRKLMIGLNEWRERFLPLRPSRHLASASPVPRKGLAGCPIGVIATLAQTSGSNLKRQLDRHDAF